MCLHKHLALTNGQFISGLVTNCKLHCYVLQFTRPKVPLLSALPPCPASGTGENSPIPGNSLSLNHNDSLQGKLNKACVVLFHSKASDPVATAALLLAG